MAALNHAEDHDNRETRERLLHALHDAGIEQETPLGILFMSCVEISASTHQTVTSLLQQLDSERQSVHAGMRDLVERLDKAFKSVEALQNTGEARLKEQELSLKQDQQALFSHFMLSLEKGLKDQVFERIRERLPTQEYTFYREARWHGYVRLVLMACGLIFLGALGPLIATWDQNSRGRYCLAHTYHDSKTGQIWCDLNDVSSP
ncbi:hypothetical protein JK182_03940 [Acetobacter okinawensis]|uniref:hypothetical protein n=1 Tax=Acetobacter okinawensis TaxID=1076594 RepID=UPI001BA965DF|nr:hypothetical protein [Acetobacter okinawensis]MBS0987841.1 hypothetical protein [Acetobacter okinawensis]